MPTLMPLPVDAGLSHLVMRRALRVGLIFLVLTLGLGLLRARSNIDDELDAAVTLARLMAALVDPLAANTPDEPLLARLRALQTHAQLRHLDLHLVDEHGAIVLGPPPAEPRSPAWQAVLDLHRRWLAHAPRPAVTWPLVRPESRRWQVTLQASADGEREEALLDLAGLAVALCGCVAGLLLVMRWNVQRTLAPLGLLVEAIGRIERGADLARVTALPAMPVRELERIAAALRHLAASLTAAQTHRRHLSSRLLTLQEDERRRLARELHDEFGQRLTALRFDIAWLTRQTAAGTRAADVVAGMADHCRVLQDDIRQWLAQLRPFGPLGDDATRTPLPLGHLGQLLDELLQGWRATLSGAETPRLTSHLQIDPDAGPIAAPVELPQDLMLAVYRLSQEALTNALRHAGAGEVTLSVTVHPPRPGRDGFIDWQVQDDGRGLADPAQALQHGSGLGGMQERVWAFGGQWQIDSDPARHPGLTLRARLPLPARPDPP